MPITLHKEVRAIIRSSHAGDSTWDRISEVVANAITVKINGSKKISPYGRMGSDTMMSVEKNKRFSEVIEALKWAVQYPDYWSRPDEALKLLKRVISAVYLDSETLTVKVGVSGNNPSMIGLPIPPPFKLPIVGGRTRYPEAMCLTDAISGVSGKWSTTFGASYKGQNYLNHNEDRWVSTSDWTMVCDGLGGHSDGEWAAETVVRAFLKNLGSDTTQSDVRVIEAAKNDMRQSTYISPGAKTCVLGIRIGAPDCEGAPRLRKIEFNQWGDCNAVIIERRLDDNVTRFIGGTSDPGFDLLERLLRAPESRLELIDTHHKTRNIVENPVGAHLNYDPVQSEFFVTLEEGVEYFVISGSDGLFDVTMPEHLCHILSVAGTPGKPLELPTILEGISRFHELRCEENRLRSLAKVIDRDTEAAERFLRTVKIPVSELSQLRRSATENSRPIKEEVDTQLRRVFHALNPYLGALEKSVSYEVIAKRPPVLKGQSVMPHDLSEVPPILLPKADNITVVISRVG